MSDLKEILTAMHKSVNLLNQRVAALEMLALAMTKSMPDADHFLREVQAVKDLFKDSPNMSQFKQPIYEAVDRIAAYTKAK